MAPVPPASWKIIFLVIILGFCFCSGHDSGSCSSLVPEPPAIDLHHHHHGCRHDHEHHHHDLYHDHEHHHDHDHDHHRHVSSRLPEELAEEEDLKLYGLGLDHDDHHFGENSELSNLSLWVYAMGCSLLVSMASLICLSILPLLYFQGKPSKTIVDSLAAFGAGAMLGDAFLHQLPHAFGGGRSHSHDDHAEHNHNHFHNVQSHSHSLTDLSVGLSVLSGIVLFLLVEKVVRYIDDYSGKGAIVKGHVHHHHGHKRRNNSEDAHDNINSQSLDVKNDNGLDISAEGKMLNGVSDINLTEQNHEKKESLLRQRLTSKGDNDKVKPKEDATSGSAIRLGDNGPDWSSSNLVLGYLNLFSDGVHNFTDGIALGSAFLLHGSIGGWSRTLFLLAHELPQEVGDFGILVRSGFSVSKALFFNFLSALVALAGTALALLLGKDPGQSALIEGFTAGGFIYIAVAGVLPEMNTGNSTVRSTAVQLTSLILGMAVALCISLVE